jgi:hypothetical protein
MVGGREKRWKWDVFNRLNKEEIGGVVMVLTGFLGMLIGKG